MDAGIFHVVFGYAGIEQCDTSRKTRRDALSREKWETNCDAIIFDGCRFLSTDEYAFFGWKVGYLI